MSNHTFAPISTEPVNFARLLMHPAKLVLRQFQHLPHLPVEVSCPYWINRPDRGIAERAYKGKGSPAEIVIALYEQCARGGLNIGEMSALDICEFMHAEGVGLGIDCSGFVYWILRSLYYHHYSQRYADSLVYPGSSEDQIAARQRGVTRAGTKVLLSPLNSRSIELTQIEPGDLIGCAGNDHVMIVTWVDYTNFVPQHFGYAHSGGIPGLANGVNERTVEVIDVNEPLAVQNWDIHPGFAQLSPVDQATWRDHHAGIIERIAGDGHLVRPNFLVGD